MDFRIKLHPSISTAYGRLAHNSPTDLVALHNALSVLDNLIPTRSSQTLLAPTGTMRMKRANTQMVSEAK